MAKKSNQKKARIPSTEAVVEGLIQAAEKNPEAVASNPEAVASNPERDGNVEDIMEESAPSEEVAVQQPAAVDSPSEEAQASESDSQDTLKQVSSRISDLKIGDRQLSPYEDQMIRAATELHYRTKNMRFRGISLTQDKLDELLKDGSFLGKIGYLRSYVPARK